MTEHSLTSTSMSPAPHRLLFLHGLFRKSYPNSGRTVAELLAKGLNGAVVSTAPDLLLDDGGRCPCYLVQPESDTAAWHTVEVVEVVYDDIIKERDGRRSLIQRALIGLWVLVTDIPRLARLLLPGYPRITTRQAGMAHRAGDDESERSRLAESADRVVGRQDVAGVAPEPVDQLGGARRSVGVD